MSFAQTTGLCLYALAPSQNRVSQRAGSAVPRKISALRFGSAQCGAANLSSVPRANAAMLQSRSVQSRAGSRALAVAVTASASVPAGSVSVVLLAGGVGKRMGANMPKQYLKLRGQEIALYSMQTFAGMPEVGEIVVVCDPSYRDVFEGCKLPRSVLVKFALPGKERQDSVESGLKSIAASAQLVAVHDSARPLVTVKEVSAVLSDAMKHGAAVLGVQTKATIKQAKPDQFVEKTLDRSLLWEMHTPQVIRPQVLRDGFKLVAEKGLAVTDDVSIVEAMGLPVFITKGEYTNLKITTPEDLFIAERLLDEQKAAAK